MKKYMFLTAGFKPPTAEMMASWSQWFESISDRILQRGGFGGGRELTPSGTRDLPWGADSMTGYVLFEAESLDEATQIAHGCPIIQSNRVYEIREG